MSAAIKVSVIIKALNEEKKIATAIQSSLDAVTPMGGEVILADSCSTDKTISIASAFPIKIVQLANSEERCCGIGPQLGFQSSVGEYVYILDGDMEFLPGFMEKAVSYLNEHPEVAGVGGIIKEMNTESLEYISRMERASGHMQVGKVDRLDMGGLYRRIAIKQVGYFSNINLHSYEEYDLGVRLRCAGWQLRRLNFQSVKHYGHDANPYELLVRRWRSGYICGLGQTLRVSLFKPHFFYLISELKELKIYLGTLLWLVLIVALFLLSFKYPQALAYLIFIVCTPFSLMAYKKKSISKGFFSVVSWIFNAGGLIRGFFREVKSPYLNINVKVIK